MTITWTFRECPHGTGRVAACSSSGAQVWFANRSDAEAYSRLTRAERDQRWAAESTHRRAEGLFSSDVLNRIR